MASRTTTKLVDDLDGRSEASVTHVLKLDQCTVTLDLTAEHSEQLRNLLQPYLAAGAPVPARAPREAGPITAADVRCWAREAGHPTPTTGRLPAYVWAAYVNARQGRR